MPEPYFWWTDEQKEVAKKVEQFVEENIEEAESYFWKKNFPWPLVKKVADFEIIVTENEIEALVLENNLIKKTNHAIMLT